MSQRTCLLLALVAQTTCHTLVYSGMSRSSALRLRGGDDDEAPPPPPPQSEPKALTREEILEKLNDIPTFTLVGTEQGGFVALKMADDDKNSICFFVDANEAKAVLEMMQKAHPERGLKLGCVGLGKAFELCGGWMDDDAADGPFANFDGHVKLRTSLGLLESTTPQLKEMMQAESMEPGSWVLPVFICEELQGPSTVPVFLNPAEVKETWEKAGRKAEDFPDKLVMMDVRMLAQKMQSAEMPWDRFQLVGSTDSATFANELLQAARAEQDDAADAADDSLGDI